jgi:hypothetical protein
LLLLLAAAAARAQPCARSQEAPYAGPLFDAMAQTGQWLNADTALGNMREAGVAKIALFARVHRKEDGRGLVAYIAERHPETVLQGAPKYFDMRDDLDASYVKEVLAGVTAGRYGFVGEILYVHGDKQGGEETVTGEREIDPTQPQTARLLAGLEGRRIPVLTHWEVYDWARDWPRFDRVYAAHPGQVFVWPHLGFASPEQAAAVLGAHANVWATLSKKEKDSTNLADEEKADDIGGPVADACERLLPEWRAVLLRFSDRLMFATDAHRPRRWGNYTKIVTRWRRILGQLPGPVASAIAYDNAARLYSGK